VHRASIGLIARGQSPSASRDFERMLERSPTVKPLLAAYNRCRKVAKLPEVTSYTPQR
jgi:hypothetical protein